MKRHRHRRDAICRRASVCVCGSEQAIGHPWSFCWFLSFIDFEFVSRDNLVAFPVHASSSLHSYCRCLCLSRTFMRCQLNRQQPEGSWAEGLGTWYCGWTAGQTIWWPTWLADWLTGLGFGPLADWFSRPVIVRLNASPDTRVHFWPVCTVCSAGASIAIYGRVAHIPLARNSGHFQKAEQTVVDASRFYWSLAEWVAVL